MDMGVEIYQIAICLDRNNAPRNSVRTKGGGHSKIPETLPALRLISPRGCGPVIRFLFVWFILLEYITRRAYSPHFIHRFHDGRQHIEHLIRFLIKILKCRGRHLLLITDLLLLDFRLFNCFR